jgi:Fe(3+) ions import ATP-binding protein fbpC
LMDEPLSNLDAKLRVEMRTAIKEIQNSIGITTVYVTHDQEEAMAVSDRIAVMKDGEIQHLGQPKDIYQRPANLFVATFIGKTNVLNGTLNNSVLKIAGKYDVSLNNVKDKNIKGNVVISIRPEEFVIDENQTKDGIKAFIDSSVFLGLNTHYFAHLESGEKIEIVQESKIDSIIPKGTEVYLKVKQDKINVFTEDGSRNILEGVNNDAIGVAYAK